MYSSFLRMCVKGEKVKEYAIINGRLSKAKFERNTSYSATQINLATKVKASKRILHIYMHYRLMLCKSKVIILNIQYSYENNNYVGTFLGRQIN